MKTVKSIKVEIFPSPYMESEDFHKVRFEVEVENYGNEEIRKFGKTEFVRVDDFKSLFEQLFDGAKHVIRTAIIEDDFKHES